jgi:polyhydroxybutyrate depolymerase
VIYYLEIIIKMNTNNIVKLLIFGTLFFGITDSENAQTEKEKILKTMKRWETAINEKNIENIINCYSNDYASLDAEGKEGVRIMWEEIKELGYMDNLDIDLTTSKLEIEDEIATFIIYDDDGEVMMDFFLEKDDSDIWLITGIPSEICDYEFYQNSYGDDCIKHEGFYRCWDIYVPLELLGKVPLVIDMHGWDENPEHQRSISGFESLAKKEGFIVVWPYGLCRSWNSGELCCPPASNDRVDDVGFVRKLIKKVTEGHNIDEKRIYISGLSNGCAMAQRIANESSDLIAAVACMSLHLLVEEDPSYDPISVMTILGTKDDLYISNEGMPGATENFEKWKLMNNCVGKYEVTWSQGNSAMWSYSDCQNETEVSLITIDEGGHTLYMGEETNINTTQLAWDFLKRFSK